MNGTLTIADLTLPWDVQTLDGFRKWYRTVEGCRIRACYAGGSLYIEMTPQSLKTHLRLTSRINRVLGAIADEMDLGIYHEQGCWITNDRADLSSEPDGCLVRWETFQSGEAVIDDESEFELVGRADMVLEVVSRSSVKKDTVQLAGRYALAGIPEYWIADGRQDPPSLRILRLSGDAYAEATPDDDGWVLSPLYGQRFRLRRVIDRAGNVDFRLDVAR